MSDLHLTSHTKLRHSQRGIISIMTAMVLMIIISLIVFGFAQLSRRNQRQTLDRQLSTQAFYAAESGVNDARELLQSAIVGGTPLQSKTECTVTRPASFYASINPDLDPSSDIKYSCLLVDVTPKSLNYNSVGSTAIVVPVVSADGMIAPISKIELKVHSETGGASSASGCPIATATVFSPVSGWPNDCDYGVLRFDLVPVSAPNLTIDTLRSSTMTTFAVPFSTGGSPLLTYAGGAANSLVGMPCTSTDCNLTIDVASLAQDSYYMRITSLYQEVSLQVVATDAVGNPLKLKDTQAVVDVTGKAGDVLRRIQVSIPLRSTSQNQLADHAIQTTDNICKRYAVMDGFYNNTAIGGLVQTPLADSVPTPSRLCNNP